jgi:hypothetical protein
MGARTARANVAFLVLVTAVLVMVGCLSPWATVRGVAFNGTDANAGKSSMIAAIAAAVLVLLGTVFGRRWLSVIAAIPAGIAAAITSYRLSDIANFVQGAPGATASWGIWLATLGSVALFVLCLVHAFMPVVREPTPVESPPDEETAPPPAP